MTKSRNILGVLIACTCLAFSECSSPMDMMEEEEDQNTADLPVVFQKFVNDVNAYVDGDAVVLLSLIHI